MLSATSFCHLVLRQILQPGDAAVDATAGNGHDTLFLTEATAPDGRVFAFDIQAAAVEATRLRLERAGVAPERCSVIQDGHENLARHLPAELRGRLGAVVFNLGYLPGGDKSIVTSPDSTLRALRTALEWLRPGGAITLALYSGHPGGAEEARAVKEFVAALPSKETHAAEYHALNAARPAPSVILLMKR